MPSNCGNFFTHNSTLSHLEFQKEIVGALLINQAGALRKGSTGIEVISSLTIISFDSDNCKWEHLSKKVYCLACKSQLPTLKRRRPLEEIDEICTKRRRASQTMWQCKSCGPCCKKEACWDIFCRCFGVIKVFIENSCVLVTDVVNRFKPFSGFIPLLSHKTHQNTLSISISKHQSPFIRGY